MGRPTLEIHPADAASRGLADGDEVDVHNDRGALRAWIKVTDSLHPGVVAAAGEVVGRAGDRKSVV